eukprot:TRINITY_DN8354_c0_g1_i9.p2 TRINITY_DN8354_c0_g1~~TRINITY_DN8354_c0_g1_i9.p2  ORF type:complete len:103 (+),score=1.95 TRINITY_DN8354_c0_g1_i9:370-678(+)
MPPTSVSQSPGASSAYEHDGDHRTDDSVPRVDLEHTHHDISRLILTPRWWCLGHRLEYLGFLDFLAPGGRLTSWLTAPGRVRRGRQLGHPQISDQMAVMGLG